MKRILVLTALLSAALVFSVTGATASPPTPFFNGFEANTAGWDVFGGNFDATRVASGMNGVDSKTGSWHAEAALDPSGTAATNWGGYTDTFPANGYSTSVDIYLNVGGTYANDTRFDWDSAISDSSGGFRRDFVFNCGYYNDSDVTGSGARFVCSASNNAGRSGAFPKNPGRSPYAITTGGWYTFEHHFYNSGGVLATDLRILDSSATVLKTWTLSDSTDTIAMTGGNRYGWFANQEFSFLAFDNSRLSAAPTCTATGFVRDGIYLTAAQIGGTVTGTLDATGCNIGAYNPTSVDDADIFGANYYGVVVNAAAANVTNTSIHDIGETPLNGSQHGVGVLYTTINQAGASTGTSATGTLSDTTITSYQKNGVVISGKGAAVTLTDNTVTGEGGVTYIAQNGIQISFDATAKLVGNDVSLNNYTPPKVTACGLLLYKAGGVSASAKTGLAFVKAENSFVNNETDICNFGKGGGFSPAP